MQEIQVGNTTRPIIFGMRDSTTGQLLAGLTLTVTISKNGGALAAPAGAVSAIGGGLYKIAANATDAASLGPLQVKATAASALDKEFTVNVVAFNPDDVTRMGLLSLPSPAAGNNGGLPLGGAGGGAFLDAAAIAAIWGTAIAESYPALNAAMTGGQVLYSLFQFMLHRTAAGNAETVYKLDGSVAFVIGLNSPTQPTAIVRTS